MLLPKDRAGLDRASQQACRWLGLRGSMSHDGQPKTQRRNLLRDK